MKRAKKMVFYNLKKQVMFILIVLLICNIIPTCAGYGSGVSKTFAMTSECLLPSIISYCPEAASSKERFFVDVKGSGFDKESRLLINGFLIGDRYIRVLNSQSLVVRVPKGVPVGKYVVVIKNPDGKTSNEVSFEVKS